MRLFIGLGLPAELARRLVTLARTVDMPHPRWSPPENLHLTLVFLGQVDPARLPPIQSELDNIRSPSLELTITHFDTFPGVLFAAITPTPELLRLHAAVSAAMNRCGFPSEDRNYHPHLTMARTRSRFGPALRAGLPRIPSAHFTATEVHLYSSHPVPGGSRYEILSSTALRSLS